MKKLSLFILSLVFICTGFFVTACGKSDAGIITLSQNSVVIYLGETEDNSVTINAKVDGVNVNKLRLYYDNSSINISQSNKKADGSFDLTVKAITTLSADPIQVRVEANKDVTAVFYVEVSLPLTSIGVQENLYIPYNGKDVLYNLKDKLIFYPQGTKQKDVFFEFVDEVQPEGIELDEFGNLLINSLEYIYSSEPIKLRVHSAEAGKSSIMNQFEVRVLQNVEVYSDEIIFETDFNGSKEEMNASNFELKIENKSLSTFNLAIKIPTTLGIAVELDAQRVGLDDEGNVIKNILNILDCATLSENKEGYTVYSFIFSTTKQLSGKGNLYFNFFYDNPIYKNDAQLRSSFVKVKTADGYELFDGATIDVVIPIKGITVKTVCKQFDTGSPNKEGYIVYKNYNTTTMQYGTEFSFGADPVNTTQTELKITTLSEHINIYRASGVPVVAGEIITINEKFYVKGNASTPEANYEGNAFVVEVGGVTKEIEFNITSGATMFGFVSAEGDTNTRASLDIAVEQGDAEGSKFYIYAPGASIRDLVYDTSVMQFVQSGLWFEGRAKGTEVGKQTYSIATNNGFAITLNLTTVAKINTVEIKLKEGTTAGVGRITEGVHLDFALKYGYSVELNFITNDNSEIAKINYSFYDTLLEGETDAYSEYSLPADLNALTFELYSNALNTQNLVQQNILTAKAEGRVVVKVEVVGEKVENGVIVEDVQETQFILIEVYKPTTHIDALETVVTLRAQNQVDAIYYDTTSITMPLTAKSNATDNASYYQLYLDDGIFQTREIEGGEKINETVYEYSNANGDTLVSASLNRDTRELTINALHYTSITINIIVYAVDFESFDSLIYKNSFSKNHEKAKNATVLNIAVKMQDSVLIDDVEVSNYKLEEETTTEKIYEEIYIDTSKLDAVGDNFIKVNTEIYPLNAFDKRLTYSFEANAGYSNNMVDVSSNDGIVRIPGTVGGTGFIVIRPTHGKNTVKTIKIPVVVADGNSYDTAYRITSLAEIRNINKHYILTNATTYILDYTLFDGKTFNGGLYGGLKDKDEKYNQMATISLDNCSLFNSISSSAFVEGLYLYGTSKNRGFVANVNHGTIKQVEVTTLIKNGVYVPSLLNYAGTESVGGIVGTNSGSVIDCAFGGSINAPSVAVENCNPIVGENDGGSVSNCVLFIAKFETQENAYTLTGSEGSIYVNANLNATYGEFNDQEHVNVITYEDHVFDMDMYIEETDNSIGEEGSEYGILMYYAAEDSTLQNCLDKANYNTINFADLFSSDDEYLKVMAFDDGASVTSNTIHTNANSLQIGGIGLFNLKVFSKLDYTQSKMFKVYSIYYFDSLTIKHNGEEIVKEGGEDLYPSTRMKSNSLQQIETTTEKIMVGVPFENDRINVKLKQNKFTIEFNLYVYEDGKVEYGDEGKIAGSNYISGQQIGKHYVNVSWAWEEDTVVVPTLKLNTEEVFNNLLNLKVPALERIFVIKKALGTTRIDLNKNEGTIEPKDVFSFEASLVTDNDDDIIYYNSDSTPEGNTIKIFSEYGKECTDAFNINVEKNELTGKFVITLSLKYEFRGLQEYVGLTYVVKVQSKDSATNRLYDCYSIVNLTILPQTITSVNTTIYQVSQLTNEGVYVNEYEAPTSVIKPLDQALLVIDLFPEYAYFDHIDIIARSSNQTKLYFSPQKHQLDGEQQILPNNYVYDKNGKFDAIPDVNGIRLQNNFGNIEQIYGKYAIIVHSNSNVLDDTIYYIDINIYDKEGNKSEQSKTVLLYVKMPPAPDVSINGETFVYAEVGETLIADVSFANNQELSNYQLKYLKAGNQIVPSDKVSVYKFDNKESGGLKTCKIKIEISPNFELDETNNELVLEVHSTIIDRGQTIPRISKVYITILDFKMVQNSVTVEGVVDGKLPISSLQAKEMKLSIFPNVENGKNLSIDKFRSQYYFEGKTGFKVGNVEQAKELITGSEDEILGTGRVLATYLSYKNGDTTYPIAKFNDEGELEIAKQDVNSYLDYAKFMLSEDGSLFVQGGDFVGEIPMVLAIRYQMPNGTVYTYEYNFTMVNSLYTTEDLPQEVANSNDFMDMAKQTLAQDYILSRDIYLYEYEVMDNTSKIKSLDGNNYTIHIMSFKKSVDSSVNYALFNTVSDITTIRNLTVNYYYLNTIDVDIATTTLNVAGFAITNNGIITNCDVATYYNPGDVTPTFTNFGLKVDIPDEYNVALTMAGFVINNGNAITNSRVGADTKTITSIKYNSDGTYKVNSTVVDQKPFTIRGAGNLAGFAFENSSIITSSFVKNISIVNTYNKQETKRTSGFVDTNNGQISLSYVEGIRTNEEVQIINGGIEGTGILSGFVYLNNNVIYDSYSNIMVKSLNDQVGRLGAGFVYENTEKASITKAYSFSKVLDGTVTQANFAGITLDLQYNNKGSIKHCYYYASTDDYILSIENLYNTSINYVKEVSEVSNFYGFAFNVQSGNRNATWVKDSNGPKLTSANNIATSFRYKVDDKNTTGNSTVSYKFLYANGYEYGTSKNPIIIRTAQELNNVLGNGKGSEYTNNFTSTKIYGAYRLVNNINLLELVSDETINSEYKYNLKSTQLILTGENAKLDGRNGSFDGNGLTISHLAISNNKAETNNYGLFKSIENGAQVINLNLTIDEGGVAANNTINVGIIAGTVIDSQIINVNIKNSNPDSENPYVVGSNMVGGVAGRVIGTSYVANIIVEDINVKASYFDSNEPNSNWTNLNGATGMPNTYVKDMSEMLMKKLSIAGGAFGAVEISQQDQQSGDDSSIDITEANVSGIEVKGAMEIYGKTVGGVLGSTGMFVVGRNLTLTLTKSETKQAKLIAYNCYAGGIVGFNRAYLYQVKSEHEQVWQTEIENNMNSYYVQDGAETVDRGNLSLFETEDDYKPAVIGGIVGVMKGGKITTSYSKLNVINKNARVAGGAIGVVAGTGLLKDESSNMSITEVYATGDVRALNNSVIAGISYTGGLIGLITIPTDSSDESTLVVNLANALNYYSLKTRDEVIVPSQKKGTPAPSVKFDGLMNYLGSNKEKVDIQTIGKIAQVQFEKDDSATDVKTQVTEAGNLKTLTSYYSYLGVRVDDGAQIDQIFKVVGWYDNGNWSRDIIEMFPHIIYTQPVNVHKINTVADFEKFRRYGYDSNSIFVVMPAEPIDCSSVTMSYAGFRGTVRGLYPGQSGFANLKRPLFASTSTANFSDLKFVNCSSAFVTESSATNYSNLKFEGCTFTESYTNDADDSKVSIAGLAHIVKENSKFDIITFSDCVLSGTGIVDYAGFLFANAESGIIKVTNVDILTSSLGMINTSKEEVYLQGSSVARIGKVFGHGENVDISSLKVSDSARVQIELPEDGKVTRANIGIVGGNANTVSINNFEIVVASTLTGLDVRAVAGVHTGDNTIGVGGLFGNAGTLYIKGTNKTIASNITVYDTNANLDTIEENSISYKNAYVGGITGTVSTLDCNSLTTMTIIDNVGNSEHPQISVQLASSATFIGGLFGSIAGDSENVTKLTYNGNIIFQEVYGNGNSSVCVGGIAGEVAQSTSVTMSEVNFTGTIRTTKDTHQGTSETYNIGGIVGSVAGTLTLKEVISLGDILINNGAENMKANSINSAGLVGYNKGTVVLENIIALTTVYTLHSSHTDNDSCATCKILSVDALVNTTAPSITGNNVKYSSNITLCVSSTVTSGDNNDLYGNILSTDKNATMMEKYTNLQTLLNEEDGSKINPHIFSYLPMETETEVGKFKIDYPRDGNTILDENKLIYSSAGTRKLYLWLNADKMYNYEQPKQIELQNAFMFSDGGNITTTVTPFNRIDSRSAVSGVISKIYSLAEDNSYAGFANMNSGVIYTSMAQEVLLDSMGKSDLTQFYGYLKFKKTSEEAVFGAMGGFVAENSGYIFGSNSNMILESEGNKVGAFIGLNSGYVDYCYAGGIIKGTAESVDLFVNENSGTITSGTSYSLVVNNITDVEEKNVSNVKFNSEASETSLVSDDALHGVAIDSNYYACDNAFNYGYATLSKNQFSKIEYIKRDTRVTQEIVDDPYLKTDASDTIYRYKKYETSGQAFYQIPNIEVFVKLGTTNYNDNYVLIRDLNLGYKTADGNKSRTSTVCSGTTLFTLDGNYNKINNVILNGTNSCVFNEIHSDTNIYNLIFMDITLSGGSSGIITTNKGELINIAVQGNITIKDTPQTVGLLVKQNDGTLDSCSFGGDSSEEQTSSNEKNTTNNDWLKLFLDFFTSNTEEQKTITNDWTVGGTYDITIGGLVGVNGGTITKTSISTGTSFSLVNTSHTNTVTFGGIVGENKATIETSGLNESAEIIVKTGGTVYVGGIAGKMTGGSISECYTNYGTLIEIGDEEKQDTSYAGGIVGYLTAGTLSDCCNEATVHAKARWRLAEGVTDNTKYEYVEAEKLLYIYQYVESKAYAGGIVGDTTITPSTENMVRLVNYGQIEGGFKAWKPIAKIAGNEQYYRYWLNYIGNYFGATALTVGVTVGLGLALTSTAGTTMIASALVSLGATTATATSWAGPVGIAITAVVAIGLIVCYAIIQDNIDKYYSCADIYIIPIGGNGVLNTGKDYYSHTNGTTEDFWLGSTTETVSFWGNNTDLIRTSVLNSYIPPELRTDFLATSEIAYKPNINDKYGSIYGIKSVTLVESSVSQTIPAPYGSYSEYHPFPSAIGVDTKVEPYFDGICHKITEDNGESLSIYSSRGVFKGRDADGIELIQYPSKNNEKIEDGKTQEYCSLNLTDNFNAVLRYTNNRNYKYKEMSTISSGATGDIWKDNKLSISYPLEFEPEIKDGKYIFNVVNSKYWSNVSYTINNLSDANGKPYIEQTENIIINIDLASTSKQYISVGTYGLDRFDGEFNVNCDVVFQNLYIRTDMTGDNSYGFIKESNGGTFSNIQFRGDVVMRDNDLSDYSAQNKSLGLFIGTANNVTINNSSFDWNILTIKEEVQHIGGVVGTALGETTFDTVDVSLSSCGYAYRLTDNSEKYSFGGIIGQTDASATITLKDINSQIDHANLMSNVNCVGGVVGLNNGTIKELTNISSNVNLLVTSDDNTYVGGVVGYSGTTINGNGIKVNTDTVRYISADVTNSSKIPYAGGVVGYASDVNIADIKIGSTNNRLTIKDASDKESYVYKMGFIMAGYNYSTQEKTYFAVPNQAYAGYVLGNETDIFEDMEIVNTTIKKIETNNVTHEEPEEASKTTLFEYNDGKVQLDNSYSVGDVVTYIQGDAVVKEFMLTYKSTVDSYQDLQDKDKKKLATLTVEGTLEEKYIVRIIHTHDNDILIEVATKQNLEIKETEPSSYAVKITTQPTGGTLTTQYVVVSDGIDEKVIYCKHLKDQKTSTKFEMLDSLGMSINLDSMLDVLSWQAGDDKLKMVMSRGNFEFDINVQDDAVTVALTQKVERMIKCTISEKEYVLNTSILNQDKEKLIEALQVGTSSAGENSKYYQLSETEARTLVSNLEAKFKSIAVSYDICSVTINYDAEMKKEIDYPNTIESDDVTSKYSNTITIPDGWSLDAGTVQDFVVGSTITIKKNETAIDEPEENQGTTASITIEEEVEKTLTLNNKTVEQINVFTLADNVTIVQVATKETISATSGTTTIGVFKEFIYHGDVLKYIVSFKLNDDATVSSFDRYSNGLPYKYEGNDNFTSLSITTVINGDNSAPGLVVKTYEALITVDENNKASCKVNEIYNVVTIDVLKSLIPTN